MEKHRSLRGTLTSRIKESIFAVFGENTLPPINMNASAEEINRWKLTPNVRRCYQNLFKPMSGNTSISYMARILERIWPDSSAPTQTQKAYAVSVCQILLNPDNKHIRITSKDIKKRLRRNLVSFVAFCK